MARPLNFRQISIELSIMDDIQRRFGRLGLFVPEIMLPRAGIDLEKWAVIACDQFTQDRGYWEKVKNTAGGVPTALNLIYPEVFLSDGDHSRRISGIHQNMERFLAENVFAEPRTGCVYVERDTPHNSGRRGLVVAVDLEHYDWKHAGQRLIRCTEGTISERLPPRMDIRRGAALETTHILLLIDDEQDTLLPALAQRVAGKAPAYRSELMLGSGSIRGWFLDSVADWAFIADELEALARKALTRYQNSTAGTIAPDAEPFLFAAGDGNHSLATAKEIWEEYKKNNAAENATAVTADGLPIHPCRYALVEIENLYDPAVTFEPIHRVLFGLNHGQAAAVLAQLPDFASREVSNRSELASLVKERSDTNRLGLISRNAAASAIRYTLIETSAPGVITAALQPLLDKKLQTQDSNSTLLIDYIHGEDELFRLAETDNAEMPAAGLLLPPIPKSGLFETVAHSGPLPRKSFSMGEACEKRFYLECRKLFG